MKRCPLGALLMILLIPVALGACHPPANVSLPEQIEQAQNLPAGSVTLLSDGALTGEGEQMLGFFDGEGNPGLAVFSIDEPPRLLSVEPASSFFSRAPDTWTIPVSLGKETHYIFLSNNPAFTCLKVQREGGQWEEIPVPPPPAMVSFQLTDTAEYLLCDPNGNAL